MTVFHVKLVTGEELLSQVLTDDEVVMLDNPMELTYNESLDGKSFIYLARYSPFLKNPTVTLDRSNIVHLEPAMDNAGVYYHLSLDYYRMRADSVFSLNVDAAVQYIENLNNDVAQPPSAEREGDDEDEDDHDLVVVDQITGKKPVYH